MQSLCHHKATPQDRVVHKAVLSSTVHVHPVASGSFRQVSSTTFTFAASIECDKKKTATKITVNGVPRIKLINVLNKDIRSSPCSEQPSRGHYLMARSEPNGLRSKYFARYIYSPLIPSVLFMDCESRPDTWQAHLIDTLSCGQNTFHFV